MADQLRPARLARPQEEKTFSGRTRPPLILGALSRLLPRRSDGKKGRIAGSLLSASSAAIVSVYTLGYMHTRAPVDQFALGLPSEPVVRVEVAPAPELSGAPTITAAASPTSAPDRLNPTPPPAAATAAPAAIAPAPTAIAPAGAQTVPVQTPVPAATVTPAATATPTSPYRDGTFVGTGNSRHGGMQVAVVIQGGKIVSAAVTACGTKYSCSDVNPLIRQVTALQKVPVDHVSGATDSSNAYKQAVAGALAQARVA
jgi:uncharacterized protein with FMN-binding domain